jgi:hypothetical protein
LPLLERDQVDASVATNCSMACTNRSVIGATITVDGTRTPSCVFRKYTTPPPVCSEGT